MMAQAAKQDTWIQGLHAQVVSIAADLHAAVLKFDSHIVECVALQQQVSQRLIEIQNTQHANEAQLRKQQRKSRKKIKRQATRLEEIETARIEREQKRDKRIIIWCAGALLSLLSFLGAQIFLQVFHGASVH